MGTNRDNKIKIKINGEEKAYQEKKDNLIVHDWKSKREVAAAEEKSTNIRSAFDIIKKKQKRKSVIQRNRPKIYTRSDKQSPIVLTISIISAIAIGVLIGIILLNLMMKNPTEENVSTANANTTVTAGTGSESVLLPSTELYILQQGVYQNEESVQQLESQLASTGLPFAYVKDGDKYRVFVAVTDGTDSGKLFKESSFFKQNFAETFPTAVAVPEKSISNLTTDEKNFLELAYPLYEKLVKESSTAFLQGDTYSIPKDFAQQEIEQIKGLKIQQKPIQDLQLSLMKAYDELVGFFDSKSNDQWLNVQSHLLSFVANYFTM
ncbi:SPOR domain-containing protein [Pallidibacillus pasinlerensis]|uniref:SPOR domain-containing protein n=1 Tax=Pallidibacillus pasinlerensis TaxID=2703818 RepID=A0ABX0A0L1_9BACI|nr:hypothetical protein [Pallidibacillus pasinlerensis]NCU16933.1 hypothetical protein [Pallidibacillus pasinlerensis]